MKLILFALLTCFNIQAADNPLALDKQKLGKTPTGFQIIHVGPGHPGSVKVMERQVPNPNTGALEDLRTLEIRGATKHPQHYTLALLKKPTYGNFTYSTRFKVLGGTGIRAAGIVFRMQDNMKDYYLLAVKPASKEAFWTVFKDNKPVQGFRFDEENFTAPKDGWQSVNLLCKNNKISWTLNHREDFVTYKPEKVPDYRDGLIGFWVRSDSHVLFVEAEALTLKEHQQKQLSAILRKISLENKRVLSLQIAARSTKGKSPFVVASLNAKEIGRQAHEVVSEVLDKEENYYGQKKGVSTVTIPLKDRNGMIFAAARMRLDSGFKTTKSQDLVYSKNIGRLIQSKIDVTLGIKSVLPAEAVDGETDSPK